MQKLLYPYLPEGMRNPQTFEWMMSNPEYRTQLEQMMEKQVCSAARHLLKTKGRKIDRVLHQKEWRGSFRRPKRAQLTLISCISTQESRCRATVSPAWFQYHAPALFVVLSTFVIFVLLQPRLHLFVFLHMQSSSLPSVMKADISLPLSMQSAAEPNFCNKACD